MNVTYSTQHIAVDLGASNGRVTPVAVSKDAVTLGPVRRFHNGPHRGEGWRWSLSDLLDGTLTEVEQLKLPHPPVSIAVDTWGVDYGWIDSSGQLLDEPYCYRDPRTHGVVAAMPSTRAYQLTGVPNQAINTSTQLLADRAASRGGGDHQLLFMPDLINFALTGCLRTELSIASTSQLIDVRSGTWSDEMMNLVGLPASCLPEISPTGSLAPLRPEIARRIGYELAVESIVSHDTASALVATPMLEAGSAYVSLGTWALIGTERSSPLVSSGAARWGFANERGLDGRFTFHRSAMGLWLLQQCQVDWGEVNLPDLLHSAGQLASGPLIDPNDPTLFEPGDMPGRLAELCAKTGQRTPTSHAEYVRCIVDSLAAAIATDLNHLEQITGASLHRLHLVGGGSRSPFICQALADACGRLVIAGPAEATTLGNALVQARAYGGPESIEEIRELVARSGRIREYRPGDSLALAAQPWSANS